MPARFGRICPSASLIPNLAGRRMEITPESCLGVSFATFSGMFGVRVRRPLLGRLVFGQFSSLSPPPAPFPDVMWCVRVVRCASRWTRSERGPKSEVGSARAHGLSRREPVLRALLVVTEPDLVFRGGPGSRYSPQCELHEVEIGNMYERHPLRMFGIFFRPPSSTS